jgi:3'-phosphoadenosine 5'-phosphosulfate (PAPS) 3'-phosphatase
MSMDEAKVALEAARAAAEVIRRAFLQDVTVRAKESGGATYNLVSDTDLEAERVIAEVIGRAFPGDAVLGEESHHGDAAARRLWVVDPLDGTNNFAHGIPHFAVSLAFYEEGQPVCGVIYKLTFFEPRLVEETAALAAGHRAVCAFVNDRLGTPSVLRNPARARRRADRAALGRLQPRRPGGPRTSSGSRWRACRPTRRTPSPSTRWR